MHYINQITNYFLIYNKLNNFVINFDNIYYYFFYLSISNKYFESMKNK